MEQLDTVEFLPVSEDLQSEISKLENDNKKLREEFNSQRAKLKDLFLQKENELERKYKENLNLSDKLTVLQLELDEAKSKLVVAGLTLQSSTDVEKRKAEEIASLQQLVHETVEESSSCKTVYSMELKKLHGIIEQLRNENSELRREKQQSPHHAVQEQTSLAPSVMLSAVTKTLARKLGADTFASQDSMEDNMRKVDADDHAQEDVEVLRSLVVPLEEEIKALKDKLRAADEQLQKCQQCRHGNVDPQVGETNQHNSTSTNTSFDVHHGGFAPCDMCNNYETELVKEQKRTDEIKAKLLNAEKSAERYREELLKEIGFRKEIEEKWNEKKEQHKLQVGELTMRTDCAEQDLKELQDVFKQTCNEVQQHLAVLTSDREKVQVELEKLQIENDHLVGKYSIHSQQLQSEVINLPNTVEELQEVVLKAHQDIIIAKIGKEVVEEQLNNLKFENLLLKDQISNEQRAKENLEKEYTIQITALKAQKHQWDKEKEGHTATIDKLKSLDKIHKATISQIEELFDEKRIQEDHINELKARVGSLQQELDNSEAVQKDFVRLSQNLQVELEKIRDSDTQTSYSKSRHRKQSLPKLPYLAKKASSRFSQYAEIRRRKDYQITKEKDSNAEVTKTTSLELDPKETDDFARNCNSAAEKLDVYVEEKILPKLQFLKKKAPSRFSQYEESQRGKDHYTNTNQKDKNKADVVVIKDHTNETTFDQVLRDLEITSKEIKKGISENLNKNTASKTQHLDSSANVSSRLVQSMKTLIVQEKPSSLKGFNREKATK
ncbi:hypothetical protein RN001_014090 [Aquatica leii]|uniref:Uncharacterized protein n=1 Tax=Aquatica leii TaxID=1421715 RepID=A0AAN7Q0F6_9COLE|nr:hypothetical protein RN001_014090 [Aquatica leii]